MNYGLPYQGSKNAIAAAIAALLPDAPALVDLFAGGCAVVHAALISRRFPSVIANDTTDAPRLFRDAALGLYDDERRWISKEDFYRLKASDPYARCLWSFNGDLKYYIYKKSEEPLKQAAHAAIFGDCSLLERLDPRLADAAQRRLDGQAQLRVRRRAVQTLFHQELKDPSSPLARLFPTAAARQQTRFEAIEHIERLRSIKGSFDPGRLVISQADYRDADIPADAVVYADIPYKSARGYLCGFDHEAFYDWAARCPGPLFISEYAMPKGFTQVWAVPKRCTFAANSNRQRTVERIFVPDGNPALELIRQPPEQLSLFPDTPNAYNP